MNTELLPKTLQEAGAFFACEENCHNLLTAMRWPDGKISCPHCGSEDIGKLVVSTRTTKGRMLKERRYSNGKVIPARFVEGKTLVRRVWNCHACKGQFSAKVGSVFEDSPLGLGKWLLCLWMLVNCKNGISSHKVARDLEITQKSAWFMLQRLRLVLHDKSPKLMTGTVEADETYIGGRARFMHKSKIIEKGIKGGGIGGLTGVHGLLERDVRKQHSRVKIRVLRSTSRNPVQKNVLDTVTPGSQLVTDEAKAYWGMEATYEHKVINHAMAYVKDGIHINGLENFWCLLKRTIKGTYVCPRAFHLFRYLDEQAFRFNERKGTDKTRFEKAARSIAGRRLTYKTLIGSGKPLA